MSFLIRLVFFSILFSFSFQSCAALKKRKHEPEVMENVGVSSAIESALQTPDFDQGEWPSHNWWTLFDDVQLSEIMELAIENNPDLMAAVSRVNAAQEEAKKVRSALFPKLDGSFKDNYQHLSKDSLDRFPPSAIPAVINQINLALNFEYEIDLFGKNRNRYQAALGKARAQAAEMSQSLLMITVALAETYFNYGANLFNLQLAQELRLAQKGLLEQMILRKDNGIEDQIGVDQAAAAFLTFEENVAIYEKEVQLNRNQLKILMGISPDDAREFIPPTPSFNRPFPLPETLPLNLLSRRPDLMAQIWNVEAAAHLISAAKADFFPNINLISFAGLESLKWHRLFSASNFAASLAPAINLPLFTGGRLTAQLNENYAQYDAAVHDYNALVLKAAKEVADQIKILQTTSEENQLQAQVMEKMINISDLTIKRYQNGIDNYLIVLQKQINLFQEGIKEVGIQNERYLSVLHLIKALGGGYVGRE